jgi:hypothetical protein
MLLAPEGSDSLFPGGRVLRQDRGARLALEPAARQLASPVGREKICNAMRPLIWQHPQLARNVRGRQGCRGRAPT